MRGCRSCTSAVVAFALATAPADAQDFGEVQAAVEAGDYAAARTLAERVAEPIESARALVWVDYGARDYVGAALAARAGLELAPEDAWLAERAAAAALAQRDGDAAATALEALDRAVRALPAPERGVWKTSADLYRRTADELVALERSGARARTLARTTVLALLGAAVLAVGWGLRRADSAHLEQP
ncbi:MAG: hypothetical protein HZA52_03850 [Planctomycetes bacterium]|nr:hypothetical protein [Planctomycetota bacterium]